MEYQTKLVSNFFKSLTLTKLTILPDNNYISNEYQNNLRADIAYCYDNTIVNEYVEFVFDYLLFDECREIIAKITGTSIIDDYLCNILINELISGYDLCDIASNRIDDRNYYN